MNEEKVEQEETINQLDKAEQPLQMRCPDCREMGDAHLSWCHGNTQKAQLVGAITEETAMIMLQAGQKYKPKRPLRVRAVRMPQALRVVDMTGSPLQPDRVMGKRDDYLVDVNGKPEIMSAEQFDLTFEPAKR